MAPFFNGLVAPTNPWQIMFIFDAHLDLSMNCLQWNLDLSQTVDEIRASEQGQTDKKDRGKGTVSLPTMREGKIGICVATMIARSYPGKAPLPQVGGFSSPEIAWAMTQVRAAVSVSESGSPWVVCHSVVMMCSLSVPLPVGMLTEQLTSPP